MSGFGFYQPSRPREVRGGIKAQSRRGDFGASWWARRWLQTLDSFGISARLARGRSYARRGQVANIAIRKGRVSAEVQGSRPAPYDVEIRVKTVARTKWVALARRLSEKAIFAAKLAAGEMPPELEGAFAEAGVPLFPARARDLSTDCSCPDWSNPCKHVAAVYYLLAEELDRDPFRLLELRGIDREELVGQVAGSDPSGRKGRRARRARLSEEVEGAPALEPEPLPAEPERFWRAFPEPDGDEGAGFELGIPPVAALLPKTLGSFPFWRGEERFLSELEAIYEDASAAGLEVLLGGEDRASRSGGGDAEPPSRGRRLRARHAGTVRNP